MQKYVRYCCVTCLVQSGVEIVLKKIGHEQSGGQIVKSQEISISSTCKHCQRNQQPIALFHLQPGVAASDQNSSDLLDYSIQMGLKYIEDLT